MFFMIISLILIFINGSSNNDPITLSEVFFFVFSTGQDFLKAQVNLLLVIIIIMFACEARYLKSVLPPHPVMDGFCVSFEILSARTLTL